MNNRKRNPPVVAAAIVLLNKLTLTLGKPLHASNPFKQGLEYATSAPGSNSIPTNPFIELEGTIHPTLHIANDDYHPALYFENFLTIFNLTALYFNYMLEKQSREGQNLFNNLKEQNARLINIRETIDQLLQLNDASTIETT